MRVEILRPPEARRDVGKIGVQLFLRFRRIGGQGKLEQESYALVTPFGEYGAIERRIIYLQSKNIVPPIPFFKCIVTVFVFRLGKAFEMRFEAFADDIRRILYVRFPIFFQTKPLLRLPVDLVRDYFRFSPHAFPLEPLFFVEGDLHAPLHRFAEKVFLE